MDLPETRHPPDQPPTVVEDAKILAEIARGDLRCFDTLVDRYKCRLVSYIGHGGIHLWADENILNRSDVPNLATQPEQPLLLTMTAAAKLLGVSRVTLWRMVKDGDIRPVEITPNVFRIRRQDLNKIASRYAKYRPTPRGIPSRNGQ